MYSLSPLNALGAPTAGVDTVQNLTLSEVPQVALTSYVARPAFLAEAKDILAEIIGANAPAVGCFSGVSPIAFWMGPEQWMIEAPIEAAADGESQNKNEELAHYVVEKARGKASVTEQNDAWVRFDLSIDDNENAQESLYQAMELLCNINSRKLDVGMVSRTSIHHIGCFVLRRSKGTFSIYPPRSFAGSLHHAVLAAMHSVA